MKKFSWLIILVVAAACSGGLVKPWNSIYFNSRAERDFKEMEQQAHAGSMEAQYELGKYYCCSVDGLYDVVQATKWLCSAARKGHRDAQGAIGYVYARETDNKQKNQLETYYNPNNDVIAYAWLSQSARRGSSNAKKGLSALTKRLPLNTVEKGRELVKYYPNIPCEITHKAKL